MFCSSIYFRVQTQIEKEIKSALRNEKWKEANGWNESGTYNNNKRAHKNERISPEMQLGAAMFTTLRCYYDDKLTSSTWIAATQMSWNTYTQHGNQILSDSERRKRPNLKKIKTH
jgi:hypothetical protein